jgi:hypothetical protein
VPQPVPLALMTFRLAVLNAPCGMRGFEIPRAGEERTDGAGHWQHRQPCQQTAARGAHPEFPG